MKGRKANGKATKQDKSEPTNREKSRELPELAKAINVKLNEIAEGIRTNARRAVEAGELLIEAKAELKRLPDPEQRRFCKWCKQNFRVSSRQLQKYMKFARYVGEAKAKLTSDLEVILDGGFETALRSFQVREEELPSLRTEPGDVEEDDDDERDEENEAEASDDTHEQTTAPRADRSSDNGEEKSSSGGLKKWVEGLYSRADKALRNAKRDGDWSRYSKLIDNAALEQTRLAAEAWTELYGYLKQLCEQGRPKSGKAKAEGPPQPSAAQLVPAE